MCDCHIGVAKVQGLPGYEAVLLGKRCLMLI